MLSPHGIGHQRWENCVTLPDLPHFPRVRSFLQVPDKPVDRFVGALSNLPSLRRMPQIRSFADWGAGQAFFGVVAMVGGRCRDFLLVSFQKERSVMKRSYLFRS